MAFVLAIVIKTFLAQAFYIPSASMENTLQGGDPITVTSTAAHPFDRILVDKLTYRFRSPHRGEIVVFKRPPGWPIESTPTSSDPVLRGLHDVGSFLGLAPATDDDFVKRVIGTPGDHVVCCTARQQLTVNGKALDEPYIDLQDEPHAAAYTHFSITVPHGDLWVMGDHRDDSDDSRVHGPIPISDVLGRAVLVIWPIKNWRTLPVPATFKQIGFSAASTPVAPFAAGLICAVPLVVGGRRWRRRR
jgi:signal peptidase I